MVPFACLVDCFDRLRRQSDSLPVHWQHDYYHITMAFIDKTHDADTINSIICRNFTNVPPIKITFNKFDAFTTHSGIHIIHLAASCIPNELRLLNEKIRKEICNTASSGTSDRTNFPSTSVTVPSEVPFTSTEAPMTGRPSSAEVTRPTTCLVCARSTPAPTHKNRIHNKTLSFIIKSHNVWLLNEISSDGKSIGLVLRRQGNTMYIKENSKQL